MSPFGIVKTLPSEKVIWVSPFDKVSVLEMVIVEPSLPASPLSPLSPFGIVKTLPSEKVIWVSPFDKVSVLEIVIEEPSLPVAPSLPCKLFKNSSSLLSLLPGCSFQMS